MLVPDGRNQPYRDQDERRSGLPAQARLRLLNCVLARETSEPNTLASWNDEPTRKHADILALIDKAIDLEEQLRQ